ncbi:MAG: aminoacyl-tRNA hydrolase [Thermodesulfovibrionales bacterium]|nr:aminoacyl-tRNA hydrolase [Thermodesulfovibrionales bacterium]
MWVVAGLGNPGDKYSRTRHNIGFLVIDRLSEVYSIPLIEKDLYIIGKGAIEGSEAILLKPLTFMNRSGIAVSRILQKKGITPDRLIIIHDDLDIDTGLIKIRRSGSSGGHKGIESIIQELGTKDFVRLKLGIGRGACVPVEKYVLSNFKPIEKSLIKDAIIKSADAVASIMTEGIDKAMNRYNRSVRASVAQT